MTTTLAARVTGSLLTPGEPGFADEVAAFNTAVAHTPDFVLGAASTNDIVEAVRFARNARLGVTMQATGHGAESPITSGLLISTRRLDAVTVDAASGIATIGGGARWSSVIAAAAPHGLTPITGSSPTVGVAGYLLGGGVGPLARSHGFGSDYLESVTAVTGTGELLEASTSHHPDLFWALRGGKGGFGVVTEMRLRLVPLRTLYAGSLFFAEEHIETAFRAWVNWTAGADPQVTTSAFVIRFPPLPFIPEVFRGRRLLSLRFAYPGATADGARLAAPLRAAAPVYVDALGELAATDVDQIHRDPREPGPAWIRGMLLTRVDQELAALVLGHFGAGTSGPFVGIEIRHLGEATGREVPGGSAVGGRSGAFSLVLLAVNPELFPSVAPAAASHFVAELEPWLAPETNINLIGRVQSADHFASAWPPDTFARLAEIRRRYDPDGIFTFGYR